MNTDNHTSIPKIDLTPKLDRPLSLWNLLDYFRLLYWVLYFPQAIVWYEKKFSSGIDLAKVKTIKERWKWLRQNSVQQKLILQGLIILSTINLFGAKILEIAGFKFSWMGVVWGSVIGSMFGFFSVTGLIIGGMVCGVFIAFNNPQIPFIAFGLSVSAVLQAVGNIFLVSTTFSALFSAMFYSVISAVVGISSLNAIYGGNLQNVNIGYSIFMITLMCMAFFATMFRLDSWLLSSIALSCTDKIFNISHVSYIPLVSIFQRSKQWLEKDWLNGLDNINHLLIYTHQFIPVVKAINTVLSKTAPEELLLKTSQLTSTIFDWEVIKYTSASLNTNLKYKLINSLILVPKFAKNRLTNHLSLGLQLNSPYRATAAGFWYLHQGDSGKAFEAFLVVENFPYGSEMACLSKTLLLCNQVISGVENLQSIANTKLPPIPPEPHLHPNSWLIINRFNKIIADVKIIESDFSRVAKSLAFHRALSELNKLIQQSKEIVFTAEKELLTEIAISWKEALISHSGEINMITEMKPVESPYTGGDPVEGDAFVGREDIINQLAELWRSEQSIPSVVLHGHRRIGKTSILRNINHYLDQDVSLAYVNMMLMSNPGKEVDILMYICDRIQITTGTIVPSNTDFFAAPETTCCRYIQQVIEQLGHRKLIIAIDEFECMDNLIATKKITPGFLQFLRGVAQLSPKIAFAFAGLHTLEERIANYDDPFFVSFIPIRVGFLSLGATRQLLANPADPDFPLGYTPETLDKIYQLTAGQPYLTQLIGFQLVRHYNNQVFEESRTRDPMLTLDDLNIVIQDPVFFDRGRYYFTGVWNQASQDIPHQQTILTALAPHPTGLTIAEISTATNLTLTELTAALKILERHDVAAYDQEKWRISIELFRRWVVDRLYAQQS
jgi:AAA ATPase domain